MARAPITVVMTTYFPPGDDGESRAQTAMRTLASWRARLHYEGNIRIHIADDGSEYFEEFVRQTTGWQSLFEHPWQISTGQQQRRGVGASLNAGMEEAYRTSPLWLYAVDDWMLTADFDLTPWADLLIEEQDVGMVRLGPPHPWLTGEIRTYRTGWGMRLDRHHFAFGHRPALYHQRMTDAYGVFAEGVNAYDCERMYNDRFCKYRVHLNGCIAATMRGGHECYAETQGCAPESERGPGIVLALPSPWLPDPDSVELAHIEPGA